MFFSFFACQNPHNQFIIEVRALFGNQQEKYKILIIND